MSEPLDSQVRDAWRRARERAEAAGRPVTPADYFPNPDPPTAWATCVANIRDALTAEFGEDRVAARFHVPDDFATFMRIDGQVWESRAEPAWALFNPTGDLYVEPMD